MKLVKHMMKSKISKYIRKFLELNDPTHKFMSGSMRSRTNYVAITFLCTIQYTQQHAAICSYIATMWLSCMCIAASQCSAYAYVSHVFT